MPIQFHNSSLPKRGSAASNLYDFDPNYTSNLKCFIFHMPYPYAIDFTPNGTFREIMACLRFSLLKSMLATMRGVPGKSRLPVRISSMREVQKLCSWERRGERNGEEKRMR